MLKRLVKDGWDGFCGFGVGILQSGENQLHVGMVYQDSVDSAPRFFHFANHFVLEKTDPSRFLHYRFSWANSGLEEENRAIMIDWVNMASRIEAQDLAYGFDVDGQVFDDEGRLLPLSPGKGVTCASFVMAAHKVHGLDLLDHAWPNRPDDTVWQLRIIEVVNDHCNSKSIDASAHIEALRNDIGAVRYRPDEVAAGVISEDSPLEFNDARTMADEIVRELLAAD